MPFDGSRFEPPPPPVPPPSGRRAGEGVLLWVIAAIALVAMLLPISADALTDLVRYVTG